MKRIQKLLSMVLVLTMIFQLAPVSVFAAEAADEAPYTQQLEALEAQFSELDTLLGQADGGDDPAGEVLPAEAVLPPRGGPAR